MFATIGLLSPVLANVALHGLETALTNSLPAKHKPGVIRYADDLVVLHQDLDTLCSLRDQAEAWLATMGLNLKASKTRITHTLHEHEGAVGFDFPSTGSAMMHLLGVLGCRAMWHDQFD